MNWQRWESGNPTSKWKLAPLLVSLGIVAAFLGTWLAPATRVSWDQLDLLLFRGLNDSLPGSPIWQWLWAAANSRPCDFLSGAFVLATLWAAYRETPGGRPYRDAASAGLLLAAILLTRFLLGDLLIERCLCYHRPSPTQVLDACQRLSLLVPSLEAKDSSPWSFPGDHGFVLLTIALYVSYWANAPTVRACWGLVILFGLPRLMAGAHWFTDLAIGSLCMALVTTALLMATPLHDTMLSFLEDRAKGLWSPRGRPRRAPLRVT